MTRKTALEKKIEELGSRPSSQATLSDLMLLECLEKMQEEKRAKRKRRQPRRAGGSIGVRDVEDA